MAYKCKVCGKEVDTAEHCGQPCEEIKQEQAVPATEGNAPSQ